MIGSPTMNAAVIGSGLVPPYGFVFITDDDGAYMRDDDGAYMLEAI
jgi:hypothetical protein